MSPRLRPRPPGEAGGRGRWPGGARWLAVGLAGLVGAGASLGGAWISDEETISHSTEICLTSATGRSLASLAGGSLYAVWFERTGPRSSIVLGAERRPGAGWSPEPERISLGDSLSSDPSVAAGTGGDLHVAWADGRDGNSEVYYRSRDAAGHWDAEERLTSGAAPSETPVVVVSAADRIHLIWSEGSPGNFELFHCWRDPGGVWSAPRRLTSDPGGSRAPAAAVGPGGEVHVAWQDNVMGGTPGQGSDGNTEIYYLRLESDGTPEGSPTRVSSALGASQQPSISLAPDGALHVFWSDNRDRAPGNSPYFPFAIWYRRWLPGLGFGHEKRFFYTAADHRAPSVAAAPDGTINVVWEDYSVGNADLSYRQIRPATGWDMQKTRLTGTVGPTQGPCLIAGPDGTLDLLWSDTTPGQALSVRYRPGRTDQFTPVVMRSVDLHREGGRLLLRWETVSETGHAGFLVYAAPDPEAEAESLTARPLTGGPRYELAIDPVALGSRRCLKLVAVSRDGRLEVAAVVPVTAEAPADRAEWLGMVHPNPSRGRLLIPIESGGAQSVRLDLFDARGRLVNRLNAGSLPAGRAELAWGVEGDAGTGVPAGRYWLRVVLDGRPMGRASPVVIVR